ncbi:MAG TPA: RsmE family RNA methyltransferase [Kofleriaceae bacterium]
MNLLLVEPAEVRDDTVTLADRRAEHLRTVLGATPGARVRAGLVGGALGTAEVLSDDGTAIALRLTLTEPPSTPLAIELVLAVPRPKVLSRTIEIAASFGVARIALTNAWRVDKSYLSSPRLLPDALATSARLGAEQGATTHVPEIAVHRRLMELLDTRWPAGSPAGLRLIAHPNAPPIESVVTSREPITLAIGPEGGWIAREVETFIARGFAPVSLGAPILRVEAAIAAALGQLVLLDRLRS